MDAERVSRVLNGLIDLRHQVESSLTYEQGLPSAVYFRRQLNDVISEVKALTIQSSYRFNLKFHLRSADEPSEPTEAGTEV